MTGCSSLASRRSRLRWLMVISAVVLGCGMLEQLAAIAAVRGIHRFDAEALANNRLMTGVFEHAGFAVRRRGSFGELTVSLDITPTEAVLERIDERDRSRRSHRCGRSSRPRRWPLWAPRTRRAMSAAWCWRTSLAASSRVFSHRSVPQPPAELGVDVLVPGSPAKSKSSIIEAPSRTERQSVQRHRDIARSG